MDWFKAGGKKIILKEQKLELFLKKAYDFTDDLGWLHNNINKENFNDLAKIKSAPTKN